MIGESVMRRSASRIRGDREEQDALNLRRRAPIPGSESGALSCAIGKWFWYTKKRNVTGTPSARGSRAYSNSAANPAEPRFPTALRRSPRREYFWETDARQIGSKALRKILAIKF